MPSGEPVTGLTRASVLREEQRPVLCIGEAMALVSPTGSGTLATASTYEVTMAGAEANVARYLSDLGTGVAWLGAVGDDPLGDRVLGTLTAVGVDVSGVSRSAQHATGVFFKDPDSAGSRVYYYRDGSAFSRLAADDCAAWPIETAGWVHISGVTPALSPGCLELTEEILRRCRAAQVPVSFDVNHRPALWAEGVAAGVLQRLARACDVVLVGLDEAQALWGVHTPAEVAAVLSGPGLVVVKDADRAATEIASGPDGVVVTEVAARRVDHVVDPVGAGDAFAAGYLVELLRAEPSAQRLEMGHSVAAWTLATAHDFRPGHGPTVRPAD